MNLFSGAFFDMVLKQSQLYDGFSYHPYRFALMDPTAQNRNSQPFRYFLNAVQDRQIEMGNDRDVYLTEEGDWEQQEYVTSSWRDTAEEHRHALFTAVIYLTALGEGVKLYNYHILRFLLRDAASTPTLSMATFHAMQHHLANGVPQGEIAVGAHHRAYGFVDSNTGEQLVALWPRDVQYGAPRRVPLDTRATLSAYDVLGARTLVTQGVQGLTLSLGRVPLMLRSTDPAFFDVISTAFSALEPASIAQ